MQAFIYREVRINYKRKFKTDGKQYGTIAVVPVSRPLKIGPGVTSQFQKGA
jgi:small neutral amino acid transporter SnatA (MarC family)